MRPEILRYAAVFVLVTGLAGALTSPAAAQEARQSPQQGRGLSVASELGPQQARDVRSDFRKVMERYPPVLGRMLKLDPGLMTNAAYLAPYPGLSAYLQQHPEIPRDPGYFLEFVNDGYNQGPSDPESIRRDRMFRLWNDLIMGVVVFSCITAVGLTLIWLVRHGIEHRRWLRATKIQSDMQNKLLERMSNNNDLLAYVQSPAGQNLLQAVPVSIDPVPTRGMAAPFSRILWSVQAGFVLAAGGAGLLVIRNHVDYEVAQVMFVVGTVGISLGLGFALAAGASYLLSQKLGLFDTSDKMRPSGGA